jgi:hypothetical protein
MTTQHTFTPQLQPTNNSCTQTATAMLLSHYDNQTTVDAVLADAHVQKLDTGEDAGSSMQQLAIYCLDQGYKIEMYSFDSLILDFSWIGLNKDELLRRFEKIKDIRSVDSLGKKFTHQYVEEYIKFIQKGGSLIIQPYPTKELLTDLIQQGPICVAVNYTTMMGVGHSRNIGLRKDIKDDLENNISTHAILVYGQDEGGDFLISDPWGAPQQNTLSSDQLIASIMAAQWLCDNVFFRVIK